MIVAEVLNVLIVFTASLCLVVFAVDLLRSSAVAAVWEFQG